MTQPAEQTDFRYFKVRSTGVIWRTREGERSEWSNKGGPWNVGALSVTAQSLAANDDCKELECKPAPAAPGGEYLLIIHSDPPVTHRFPNSTVRESATVEAIFGDSRLAKDEYEQAERYLENLRETGRIRFEGDPSIEWRTEPSPPAGGGAREWDIWTKGLVIDNLSSCRTDEEREGYGWRKIRVREVLATPPPAATPKHYDVLVDEWEQRGVSGFTEDAIDEEGILGEFVKARHAKVAVDLAIHYRAKVRELERESAGLRAVLREAGDALKIALPPPDKWDADANPNAAAWEIRNGDVIRLSDILVAIERLNESALAGGEEGKDV